MTEEQVTRAIMKFLEGCGWTILDYDFPGGGTGRRFHLGVDAGEKTKGDAIPDIIAIKDKTMLILEDKSVDTLSDYEKINQFSQAPSFRNQLQNAYPEVVIERIVWGIGYSGKTKHMLKADSLNVNVIIVVDNGGGESLSCRVIYGAL